jgi:serine/threonine protein kinase
MSSISPWNIEQLIEELHSRYEREGLITAWFSEERAVGIALHAIASHLPHGRYTPKKVLGVGGSGIVLQLEDQMFPEIYKALKFPRPVDGRIMVLTEMLTKEIDHLANLRHPGIVSIVDYANLGSVEVYQRLPFYLMEFVDGAPSREFVRDQDLTEEKFRQIIRETAGILAYLHAGRKDRIAHLDLKAENIMVTSSGRPVLIDLGTCKSIRADDTLTIVACTRSNAHPELVRLLQEDPSDNNRARGELPRSKIDPNWDLWAFGLTLLDWLGVDRDTGNVTPEGIYHRLKSYTRKYYMLLSARLLSYSVRSWLTKRVGLSEGFLRDFPVTSAPELCQVLDVLEGRGGPLAKIEELSTPSSGTIQAAPGLHVAFTPALKAVIDHRLYRRLNSITQLGVVSQVYTVV